MTLLLTLLTPTYIVQASDGRLTIRRDAQSTDIVTDVSSKSIVVHGSQARYSVAYTGPADLGVTERKLGKFNSTPYLIARWLTEMRACDLAPSDVVTEIKSRLERSFKKYAQKYIVSPLTVVMAGLLRRDGLIVPFRYEISNAAILGSHTCTARFDSIYHVCLPDTTQLCIHGATSAFTLPLKEKYQQWSERGLLRSQHLPSIEKCLVRLVREAAQTAGSGRLIGESCITVSISHSRSEGLETRCTAWPDNSERELRIAPIIVHPHFTMQLFKAPLGLNPAFVERRVWANRRRAA